MIIIDNVQAFGFEGALRGMRMPFESFNKSDSKRCKEMPECYQCIKWKHCPFGDSLEGYSIGKADMTLCKKLIIGGSEHRKFLRMIHVQADVLAPRYWWAEMDKYKYVEANSSSTMHLITKKHVTGEDFSIDFPENPSVAMKSVIFSINTMIDEYNSDRWNAQEKNTFLIAIKQLLPESYNQLRTIDTNYECLLSIYHQRHSHRLSEWREFCSWIESLPYMKEFLS